MTWCATRVIGIGKFMPVSVVPLEVSHLHQTDLARKLGSTGLRRLPQMKNFACERYVQFKCGEGPLNRGNSTLYTLMSDFLMMRDQLGPFAGLADQVYEECLKVLWLEVVQERRVRIQLIDDISRPLPIEVQRFIHGYEGIMAIDNQFTMRVHDGTLIRSFCERTKVPSPRNEQIDQTVGMLESLSHYVTHPTTIPGIVDYLKTFSRTAA